MVRSKKSTVAKDNSSFSSSTPGPVDVLPEKGDAEKEHSASLAIFFVLCVLGNLTIVRT